MSDTLAGYEEVVELLAGLPLVVREARRQRGLTMREAANSAGCSAATIHRIEAGKDCSLSSAIAILRWLDRDRGRAELTAKAQAAQPKVAEEVEVYEMTGEEWGAAIERALDRLGITWEELMEQGRRSRFDSTEVLKLWHLVRPRA